MSLELLFLYIMPRSSCGGDPYPSSLATWEFVEALLVDSLKFRTRVIMSSWNNHGWNPRMKLKVNVAGRQRRARGALSTLVVDKEDMPVPPPSSCVWEEEQESKFSETVTACCPRRTPSARARSSSTSIAAVAVAPELASRGGAS